MLITTWCVTLYCEVLVLTHELAAIEEMMPYLSLRLSPMPVVEMVGRSRAMQPTCPPDASVYHWWRGRVFFFMRQVKQKCSTRALFGDVCVTRSPLLSVPAYISPGTDLLPTVSCTAVCCLSSC